MIQLLRKVSKAVWMTLFFCLLTFCLGILLGWWVVNKTNKPLTSVAVREVDPAYKFTNPYLYTETPEAASFPEYQQLQNALSTKVSSDISANEAADVSVYFRDMNSGHWVAVNPNDTFSLASALKVATLITALHVEETASSARIQAPITIESSVYQADSTQDFYPPKNPVEIGQTYTLDQLLQHLIIDSDNTADEVIRDYVGTDEINRTYEYLHVSIPTSNTSDTNTAQEYSHFFRVLYNATYLSADDSEYALKLLSETTFTQGLVAGVPTGTMISHKFGERTITSPDGTTLNRELHDCGIVYYPGHPYFLCVMTRGSDFPTLAGVIRDISSTVWGQVAIVEKGQ